MKKTLPKWKGFFMFYFLNPRLDFISSCFIDFYRGFMFSGTSVGKWV